MSSPQNDHDEFDEFELDLDSARSARAEMGPPPTVKIDGEVLELPRELPLDVLEPLTGINVDVSVLVSQVLDARKEAKDSGEAANEAMLEAVVNMLVVNPSLPAELVDAAKEMARRLFGPEGYAHLIKQRLSLKDIAALARFLLRRYGVGLGEALPSSDSSEGTGTTSKPTSRGAIRGSTSGTSGGRRRTRAS